MMAKHAGQSPATQMEVKKLTPSSTPNTSDTRRTTRFVSKERLTKRCANQSEPRVAGEERNGQERKQGLV